MVTPAPPAQPANSSVREPTPLAYQPARSPAWRLSCAQGAESLCGVCQHGGRPAGSEERIGRREASNQSGRGTVVNATFAVDLKLMLSTLLYLFEVLPMNYPNYSALMIASLAREHNRCS